MQLTLRYLLKFFGNYLLNSKDTHTKGNLNEFIKKFTKAGI